MNQQVIRLQQAALDAHGITGKSELARRLHVLPQTIYNWGVRGMSKEGMLDAQRLLGISAMWIETGTGPMMVGGSDSLSIPTPKAKVPLISWVRAGSWTDVEDQLNSDQEAWVYADECRPSSHAFALRVEGDSMTSPVPPSFPDGCIIIVDPDRAPKAGDYVVAKDITTQRATFKRLMTDGNRWYLKPLNTAYPAIEVDDPAMRVIGVAIEWKISGKL